MVGVVEGALFRSMPLLPSSWISLSTYVVTRACPSRRLSATGQPLTLFALKGIYLAASREISMLFRSFSKCAIPAWDVTLVLQSMTRGPYEPLQTLGERFLAQKALFLLSLALAKRVGKLHALSYRVSHSRDWGEVSFSFIPGFVVKTQDPSSSAPRFEGFTVPGLPNSRTNHNGRLLCPVWVVRYYLDRTAPHRPRCEWLFVTAGCSKKKIAKNTVSFWFRKTISRAYQLSGQSLLDLPLESQRDPWYRSISSV